MPKKLEQGSRWTTENWAVLGLATAVSVSAFLFCFHHNLILLYGDAEGHINIARRMFDSRSPGFLQLGTVWLPLPHLLMLPFLLSNWAWRTAVGGSIPSMIAYIFSVVGIFRLVRLSFDGRTASGIARFAAWFAVLVFAGNPSLIYLQATAMTEPLYLALFVWAIVFLVEFRRAVRADDWSEAKRALSRCGLILAACTMTRYDGWIAMAAVAMVVLAIVFLARPSREAVSLRAPILRFLLICAAGPLLWFAYNTAIYRNPIEFANGPYSAKAIERRIVQPPHPGTGSPSASELYFLRAVEMNLASTPRVAKIWLLLAALGTLLALCHRDSWPLLLLWIPLPFYAFSVAYSGVPIFVPDWWPFGIYNLRYGLQVLPAVAVFSGIALAEIFRNVRSAPIQQAVACVASAFWLWTALGAAKCPASYLEASHNMQGRVSLQERLAVELQRLPPDSSILMALRDFPGAPQRAGVPLHRLIDENDQRLWKRPADEDGLWNRALLNPQLFADYAVGFAGDPVDATAVQHHLIAVYSLEVSGQPRATIYRAR